MDSINGHTRLYGLFAHPAKHSLSPLMHNLSFQHRQINAVYLAFDLTESLDAAINSIRLFNMGGVNLSMPFKREVLPLLDRLTPEAQMIGAVNTIINRDGELTGTSTDGPGFFASLSAKGYPIENKTATILGAGGAGRSIIAAGASCGLRSIHVFKRHNATFQTVSDTLDHFSEKCRTSIQLYDYNDETSLRNAISESDFLINTTNIGMGNDRSIPVPAELIEDLDPSLVVCDVIYEPRQTRLLQAAREKGCVTFNGLGMLIYQGALAFQLWTGQSMPVKKVEKAIQEKLYPK